MARLNRGNLLTLLGDFRQAEPLLLEARDAFERRGEEASVLLADNNLATLYAAQGHLSRALRLLGEVLAARERAGAAASAAWAALHMVELLPAPQPRRRGPGAGRGDRGALHPLRDAHRSGQGPASTAPSPAPAWGSPSGPSTSWGGRRRLSTRPGSPSRWGWPRCSGPACSSTPGPGRPPWTRRTGPGGPSPPAGQWCARPRRRPCRPGPAWARGARQEARALAQSVLRVAGERDLPWLTYLGQQVLGDVAAADGRWRAALDAYEQAISSIEQVQGRLTADLGARYLDDKLEVYRQAIACALRLDDPRRAFATLERAKSRALVAYLTRNAEVRERTPGRAAGRPAGRAAGPARGARLALRSPLRAGPRAPDRPLSQAETAALQAEIAGRERRIRRLQERLLLTRDAAPAPGPARPRRQHSTPPAHGPRTRC